MDPGADAALIELAGRLADPYAKFHPNNKSECKEHFEALTRLLEDKPNRDFWIADCNGLALCVACCSNRRLIRCGRFFRSCLATCCGCRGLPRPRAAAGCRRRPFAALGV